METVSSREGLITVFGGLLVLVGVLFVVGNAGVGALIILGSLGLAVFIAWRRGAFDSGEEGSDAETRESQGASTQESSAPASEPVKTGDASGGGPIFAEERHGEAGKPGLWMLIKLGALVGLGVGLGTLLLLHGMGVFDTASGTVFLGGLVTSFTMLIALSLGMVIALFCGYFAVQRFPEEKAAASRLGGVGAGLAHGALVGTLLIVLIVGFAVSTPGTDGSTADGGGAGSSGSSVPFDGADVLVGLLSLLPAALVGFGAARVLHGRGLPR